MNILCSVNETYIRQFKCMLFSLCESQSDPLSLFFLNGSLSKYQIENIRAYTEALNIKFHLIEIPEEILLLVLLDELERFEGLPVLDDAIVLARILPTGDS